MAGVFASVVAAYVSLRLSPPTATRPNPVALLQLALRFLRQSVVAGVDVAWRAFHPALPLHPGFVTYHSGMSGRRRDAFCTMTSLLPGTLPVETRADGTILIHCLDTRLPIAEQLKDEEALFARATGSKQ
jgi:multicomponent Na+:H+ antiporter subunit E